MRPQLTGFVGALAVIVSAAYVAISVSALLGLASTPGPDRIGVVLVMVVVAFALGSPRPGKWHAGAWAGVAVGLTGVIGLEFVTGNTSVGAGQLGAIVGAALAVPVLKWAWSATEARWLIPAGGVLLLVLVSVGLIRAILDGGGLGHDESAYALKARTWLAGTPDTGWQLHRAPLNSLLGVPVIAFTENEVAIRSIAVALAVGSLAALGLVAKHVGGSWSAIVAMATVGASLSYLRRGSEYLTDVPSAGLLLLITWIVLKAVRDPDASRRLILWLGPLIAAAFYMRYQASLGVVGIALAAMVVWPRAIVRLKRPLILTSAITLVALLPHMIWATIVAGSPTGVVLVTQDAAGREYLGEGLVDYVSMFPVDLAGPAGALLMSVAIGWMVWRVFVGLFRQRSKESDLAWFVLIVMLVTVVPLGLVAHGEPRFVFFPVWLLIALGSSMAVRLVTRLTTKLQVLVVAVAVVLWLPLFTFTLDRADGNAEARGTNFSVVVNASNEIEDDGMGSCAVLTTYEPQVNWYSTCWTELFDSASPDLGVGAMQGDRRYALLFENGKREPTGDTRRAYIGLGPTQIVDALDDRIGDATIVKITPG